MSLQAAREALQRGDLARARALAHQQLQSDPHNEAAWELLIDAARDDAERTRAIERTLRLNPDNARALQAKQQPASPPAAVGKSTPAKTAGGGRIQPEAVYEMQWDCAFCGTPKLLGKTHRFCPNCGAPQDPAKRYFPADEEKVAVKDHEYVGADKICPACQNPNSASAEFCTQCGSPLDAAKAAQVQADEVRREGEKFGSGKDKKRQAAVPPPPPKRNWIKWVAGGVGAIALIAIVIVFWTQELGVELAGHSWQREIRIEDFNARSQSEWCDSMPGDAYNVSRHSEVRSHRQVPDGQECSTRRVDRGDGTYSERQECRTKYRSEPVYDDRCSYQVDRWAYGRSLIAQGKDKNPAWPALNLSRAGNCRGCEREGGRVETYTLHLQNPKDQKVYDCEVAADAWQNSQPRSRWKLEIGVVDGAARCGSLQPAG
jgi:ribosomal protein L40E